VTEPTLTPSNFFFFADTLASVSLIGLDEFGREHLLALGLASAASIARAIYMAALLFSIAAVLAVIVEVGAHRILGRLIQVLVDGFESVPIYVWVLAAVSWAPQQGAAIATFVFVIAGVPLAFNTLRGTVRQITRQPYYHAAIALGANEWWLVRRHIIPNALPHCIPLLLHVTGAAMAVYGGVGVFGFLNRKSLDLGVFLLRGKEQASFDVTILALTLLAYVIIFLALLRLMRRRCH
jgi:peptide/nickel transport system permease protein